MVEKTFSYKDDYPCIYEGMNFYLSKFSLKKRKNYILCFIISFLVISLYNFFEILRIDDGFFTGILIFLAFAFSAVSVIYFHVYNKIHLKAVASKMFHLQKDTKKQIVLRQNDVVFLRDCCISNYYYDEFVAIIEGKKSISFVIEKDANPIIVSKTQNEDISSLCDFLKEKTGERYINMSKGGAKK